MRGRTEKKRYNVRKIESPSRLRLNEQPLHSLPSSPPLLLRRCCLHSPPDTRITQLNREIDTSPDDVCCARSVTQGGILRVSPSRFSICRWSRNCSHYSSRGTARHAENLGIMPDSLESSATTGISLSVSEQLGYLYRQQGADLANGVC